MTGVKYPYGYYANNKFIEVTGKCPISMHCSNVAMSQYTYGTLNFDGLGNAKFLAIKSDDKNITPINTVWKYTITSPSTVLLGTVTKGATLTLGDFNANGVAQTVLIRTNDAHEFGTAILLE